MSDDIIDMGITRAISQSSLRRALELEIKDPWIVDGHGITKASSDLYLIYDRAIATENLQLIANALNFYVRRKVIKRLAGITE